MAEIINLRAARKARERGIREVKAEDNRIRFGRPKKARTLAEAKTAIEVSRHEGHKLVGGEPTE